MLERPLIPFASKEMVKTHKTLDAAIAVMNLASNFPAHWAKLLKLELKLKLLKRARRGDETAVRYASSRKWPGFEKEAIAAE